MSLFIYLPLICIYTSTHVHSLGFFFAKLAMPQIEILGMVGLLAFVSTPDRHPGGSVCLKCFVGMKKRSHEFKTKRISIKIVNISKVLKQAAVFINLRTCSELYKKQKVYIQKLHQIPIPTHSRSMNFKTRTRRYGKNIGRCAF